MTTRSKAKALPAQIDALKAKQSELSRELHQKVLAKEFEVEKQQKELAEVQQQIALYKNVLGLEVSSVVFMSFLLLAIRHAPLTYTLSYLTLACAFTYSFRLTPYFYSL